LARGRCFKLQRPNPRKQQTKQQIKPNTSMKLLTKLSLSVAALVAIGTTAAFADDSQLQNRLAWQQAQNPSPVRQTTVAVYASQRGVVRRDVNTNEQGSEARFELRTNAHGQTFGLWVEAK
jgi:hypothetical protein